MSAWVAANAGSGKTHVLAQRVIRLLLDGVEPGKDPLHHLHQGRRRQHGEPRVRRRCARWTALDDDALDAAIARSRTHAADPARRARARRLFALALETPGGLKVQTIHAFCTRLLHQFPFEADVAARFAVLDERRAGAAARARPALGVLLEAAAARQPRSAARSPPRSRPPPTGPSRRWSAKRSASATSYAPGSTAAGSVDARRRELCGIARHCSPTTVRTVESEIVDGPLLAGHATGGAPPALGAGLEERPGAGATALDALAASGAERADTYLSSLLHRQSSSRASGSSPERSRPSIPRSPTPPARSRSGLLTLMRAPQGRRLPRPHRRADHHRRCRDRTATRREKDRRGAARLRRPDRQDARSARRRDRAAWVHYKLDLGIDHVLIDEAQDTSPKQWEIIERADGRILRRRRRARPSSARSSRSATRSSRSSRSRARRRANSTRCGAHFERSYARRAIALRDTCRSVTRSARCQTVLGAVDTVFERRQAFSGSDRRPMSARCTSAVPRRGAGPGRNLADARSRRTSARSRPGTRRSTSRRNAARRSGWRAQIAATWHGSTATLADSRRASARRRRAGAGAPARSAVRGDHPRAEGCRCPGRRRRPAGADRAYRGHGPDGARRCAAAARRRSRAGDRAQERRCSGSTTTDLFELAWERKTSPARRVARRRRRRNLASPQAAAGSTACAERRGRNAVRVLCARARGREQGRQRFLARLGHEADDALDEFLNLALDYETPRDAIAAGLRRLAARGADRRQTRHGNHPRRGAGDDRARRQGPGGPGRDSRRHHDAARGTATASAAALRLGRRTSPGAPGHFVWAGARGQRRGASRGRPRARSPRERGRVPAPALCGDDARRRPAGRVRRGRRAWPAGRLLVRTWSHGALCRDLGAGRRRRWQGLALPSDAVAWPASRTSAAAVSRPERPSWLERNARSEPPAMLPLSPSRAYDEAAAPMRSSAAGSPGERRKALARGVLDAPAAAVAARHSARGAAPRPPAAISRARPTISAPRNSESLFEQVLARARRCALRRAVFARKPCRSPDRRARLNGRNARRLRPGRSPRRHGDAVLIADYKTNRPAPRRFEDVPPRLHVASLRSIARCWRSSIPDKPIRAALIWTQVPDLMEIPAATLDRALAAVTSP